MVHDHLEAGKDELILNEWGHKSGAEDAGDKSNNRDLGLEVNGGAVHDVEVVDHACNDVGKLSVPVVVVKGDALSGSGDGVDHSDFAQLSPVLEVIPCDVANHGQTELEVEGVLKRGSVVAALEVNVGAETTSKFVANDEALLGINSDGLGVGFGREGQDALACDAGTVVTEDLSNEREELLLETFTGKSLLNLVKKRVDRGLVEPKLFSLLFHRSVIDKSGIGSDVLVGLHASEFTVDMEDDLTSFAVELGVPGHGQVERQAEDVEDEHILSLVVKHHVEGINSAFHDSCGELKTVVDHRFELWLELVERLLPDGLSNSDLEVFELEQDDGAKLPVDLVCGRGSQIELHSGVLEENLANLEGDRDKAGRFDIDVQGDVSVGDGRPEDIGALDEFHLVLAELDVGEGDIVDLEVKRRQMQVKLGADRLAVQGVVRSEGAHVAKKLVKREGVHEDLHGAGRGGHTIRGVLEELLL